MTYTLQDSKLNSTYSYKSNIVINNIQTITKETNTRIQIIIFIQYSLQYFLHVKIRIKKINVCLTILQQHIIINCKTHLDRNSYSEPNYITCTYTLPCVYFLLVGLKVRLLEICCLAAICCSNRSCMLDVRAMPVDPRDRSVAMVEERGR